MNLLLLCKIITDDAPDCKKASCFYTGSTEEVFLG
jgi:hypothetical protein